MKKQIFIPIISILLFSVIFLLSEMLNFTTITNQHKVIIVDSTQVDNDSCVYYLNRAVKFTLDTLAGIKEYKNQKEIEVSNCVEDNIQLIKKLEANKVTINWRTKYIKMENRFKDVEKENIYLISENYELKNSPNVIYKTFKPNYKVGNELLYFSDSIIYDDENKTVIDLKIPYFINYYENGEHVNPPDGISAEIIYTKPKILIYQEVSIINLITEEENKLVTKSISKHPNVIIHNKETIFNLSKRRIRQLVKKIDPKSRIISVK